MRDKELFKTVKSLKNFKFRVTFLDGAAFIYDMGKVARIIPHEYGALLNTDLWNLIHISKCRSEIEWNDDISISGDCVRNIGMRIKLHHSAPNKKRSCKIDKTAKGIRRRH